jgi:hypothetical protein
MRKPAVPAKAPVPVAPAPIPASQRRVSWHRRLEESGFAHLITPIETTAIDWFAANGAWGELWNHTLVAAGIDATPIQLMLAMRLGAKSDISLFLQRTQTAPGEPSTVSYEPTLDLLTAIRDARYET